MFVRTYMCIRVIYAYMRYTYIHTCVCACMSVYVSVYMRIHEYVHEHLLNTTDHYKPFCSQFTEANQLPTSIYFHQRMRPHFYIHLLKPFVGNFLHGIDCFHSRGHLCPLGDDEFHEHQHTHISVTTK